MEYNEDGKIEVNGLVFHKANWHEIPERLSNPLGNLSYIKKKTDLAERFRRYFMDYKYPQMDEHKEDLNYDQERKLSTDFLIKLGFVSKDIERWPYASWTHKLKLDDLKDLFIQTFSNDVKEDMEKYEASNLEYAEYHQDMKNRRTLAEGIEEYIVFKCAFTNRRNSLKELIENIELKIGQGAYRYLASDCGNYRPYEYVPKDCRINSFEAMDYAKDWLRTFEPVIEELNRLDDVLNFPYSLQQIYNEIPDEKLRKMHLSDLTNFKYQNFLTFLMDFKKRFGDNDNGFKNSEILTGWTIDNHDYDGKYRNGSHASYWNVFDCSKDEYRSRHGTWGQWLDYKALNGEIEALSDPQTLRDIVNRTNLSRHRHNEQYELYKKPQILVLKTEVEE